MPMTLNIVVIMDWIGENYPEPVVQPELFEKPIFINKICRTISELQESIKSASEDNSVIFSYIRPAPFMYCYSVNLNMFTMLSSGRIIHTDDEVFTDIFKINEIEKKKVYDNSDTICDNKPMCAQDAISITLVNNYLANKINIEDVLQDTTRVSEFDAVISMAQKLEDTKIKEIITHDNLYTTPTEIFKFIHKLEKVIMSGKVMEDDVSTKDYKTEYEIVLQKHNIKREKNGSFFIKNT